MRKKEIASSNEPMFKGNAFGLPERTGLGNNAPNTNLILDNPELNRSLGKVKLDWANWLPFCSKIYNISDDVRDYVLQPILTIPSDLPNRNGVGFPIKELVKFSVEHGMQHFSTWKGKPLHVEHDNQIPHKAIGVVVDSYLRKLTGYGGNKVWKVIKLLAVDRTKNRDIANEIMSGNLNSYSMGAMVSGYLCSYCHKELGNCSHIDPNEKTVFYELNGKLVYKLALDPVGFILA